MAMAIAMAYASGIDDKTQQNTMAEKQAKARNFREYQIWKDSKTLAKEIYQITDQMPWFEKKGLCDQIQRAIVSVSSNIAEGTAHPSDLEFAHYLDIALGSAYEVETQLLIAEDIGYISKETTYPIIEKLQKIQKQTLHLINILRNNENK